MKVIAWISIYSAQLNQYLVIRGKDIEEKEYFQIPIFQSKDSFNSKKLILKAISNKLFQDTGLIFQLDRNSYNFSNSGEDQYVFWLEFESDIVIDIRNYINTNNLIMPLKQIIWIDKEKYIKLYKKQLPKELDNCESW